MQELKTREDVARANAQEAERSVREAHTRAEGVKQAAQERANHWLEVLREREREHHQLEAEASAEKSKMEAEITKLQEEKDKLEDEADLVQPLVASEAGLKGKNDALFMLARLCAQYEVDLDEVVELLNGIKAVQHSKASGLTMRQQVWKLLEKFLKKWNQKHTSFLESAAVSCGITNIIDKKQFMAKLQEFFVK